MIRAQPATTTCRVVVVVVVVIVAVVAVVVVGAASKAEASGEFMAIQIVFLLLLEFELLALLLGRLLDCS